jgi:hypothetical protein
MDTSAELAPEAGPDPKPPHRRQRAVQGGPAPSSAASSAAARRADRDSRISLDPLRATDRYRLVMPYDQRL